MIQRLSVGDRRVCGNVVLVFVLPHDGGHESSSSRASDRPHGLLAYAKTDGPIGLEFICSRQYIITTAVVVVCRSLTSPAQLYFVCFGSTALFPLTVCMYDISNTAVYFVQSCPKASLSCPRGMMSREVPETVAKLRRSQHVMQIPPLYKSEGAAPGIVGRFFVFSPVILASPVALGIYLLCPC